MNYERFTISRLNPTSQQNITKAVATDFISVATALSKRDRQITGTCYEVNRYDTIDSTAIKHKY